MVSPVEERIDALDALRGFAVLGILVMNIQSFAMPMAAYLNPSAFGSMEGIHGAAWAISHVLADQKMMALFSMLFGAGIVLFCERAAKSGRSEAGYHYRRNVWLMMFGLLHGYLLWHGDILFLYALCAFVLFPLRKRQASSLFKLGIAFLAVSSIFYMLTGVSLDYMPPEAFEEQMMPMWQPDQAAIAAEIGAFQGGWLTQMSVRVPMTQEMQGLALFLWGFWRASGMMLLGMALYKTRMITGQADNKVYRRYVQLAVLVGVPLVGFGIYWNFQNNWQISSMFFGSQFNYWGSVLISLGFMSVILLLLKNGIAPALTTRLAAVGRMAFSNYIMHTVLCGLIFYGHGLGLIGQVERAGQLLIVFGIWALQLWLSPIWLRHFRFGPLEWLWRSLTYWKVQPMRV
ncbi:DUF418 domain-containing protein [Gammaproteobacteria bacterium LSUCC0112]|nr:DUF418 domain-containing protein [Gammaproteobacteria bacterium LSUCC0112]